MTATRRLPEVWRWSEGWKGAGLVLVCTDRGKHRERRLSSILWDDQGRLYDWSGRALGRLADDSVSQRITLNNQCPTCGRNVPLRGDTLARMRRHALQFMKEGSAPVFDVSQKR